MNSRRLRTSVVGPLRRVARRLGYDVVRYDGKLDGQPGHPFDPDFGEDERAVWDRVCPFTMTSAERVAAVCRAVKYLVSSGIAGDIVECGVWRGGSIMAAALTLLQMGDTGRDLWLFDTFEGMTEPTERDVSFTGMSASTELKARNGIWCDATLDDVERNVGSTGYDPGHVHFVKGRVEETIPAQCPGAISLLRLDTDWYESTKHELAHLFPKLARGGVLIIDDYGHWRGSRQATDEYFQEAGIQVLLNKVDYTGRICVKP